MGSPRRQASSGGSIDPTSGDPAPRKPVELDELDSGVLGNLGCLVAGDQPVRW